MNQPPTGYQRLPEPIPEDATLQERLAQVYALRLQQDSRAAALTEIVTDPDSLDAIIRRTEARRAEQARRDREAHAMPTPAATIRDETSLHLAQDGLGEDKESANLLGEAMRGQPILSASSAGESDRLLTQTGPGQNAETTAELTDQSEATQGAAPAGHAHPSPTPDRPRRFTGGLQNEESKAPRTTLTDEIKQFIVKGLACYDTPSQVAEAATLIFGVAVSRQLVYRYDPDNPRPPAQRWRDLHAATRQALLRELGEIGIAHRAVRLRRLDRLASRSERNNVMTALKCLEMAAKECGGMYEKRRPIAPQVPASPLPTL